MDKTAEPQAPVKRAVALRRFLYKVGADVPRVYQDAYPGYTEDIEMNELLFSLPSDHVKVFVCLNLRMKSPDIVRAANLRDIGHLYSIRAALKAAYRKKTPIF